MRRCAVVLALGFLAACSRSYEKWGEDLLHRDPWRREMAVLALRSAPDEHVHLAVRGLLAMTKDRERRVVEAAYQSLLALGPRAVDELVLQVQRPKTGRDQIHDLCVELLERQAGAGNEKARQALDKLR